MSEFYLNERVMQLCVEEEHRQAKSRRLKKLVRRGRTRWLAQQRKRALSRLGCILISAGSKIVWRRGSQFNKGARAAQEGEGI